MPSTSCTTLPASGWPHSRRIDEASRGPAADCHRGRDADKATTEPTEDTITKTHEVAHRVRKEFDPKGCVRLAIERALYGGTDAIAAGFGQDGIVLQIVRTSVPVARVVRHHAVGATEIDAEAGVG